MRWWLVIIVLFALLAGALTMIVVYSREPVPAPPATKPAQPTSKPSSATALPPPPPAARIQAYSDLLRLLPGMADAAIAEEKLPLEQAARIHLPYWAYICPRRDLWISHPDAPPINAVADEGSRGVHLTREQVCFVHWYRSGRAYKPLPVVRDSAGGCAAIRKPAEPVKLARDDYHWEYAVSLDDGFVVPTDRGISLVRVGAQIAEEYRELADRADSVPCIELTPNGFVAWVTDSPAKVAWYSKGQFQELPANWSSSFLHLVPFADGSVLQIIPEALGKVRLQIATLETTPPDTVKVKQLVRDLSDDDSEVRDEAHAQLAAMGPAAWDVLESLIGNEQGEARVRIEEIIRSRTRPALGRFTLVDGMLRPIWRVRDGVVFLAEAGVKVQSGSTEEQIEPAWIAIRRGRPIELLPPALTRNLAVGSVDLYCVGGDWVVSDETSGAQLFFGQELIPLTKGDDLRYRRLVGIDRQSRVLLAENEAKPQDLLLIDSSIADPTPLLQIWSMPVEGGEAGWTSDGWPAVKRGGAWTLKKDSWDALKGELISTDAQPTTRPGSEGVMTKVAGETSGATVWISDNALELQLPNKTVHQPRPSELPPGQLGGIVAGDRLYLVRQDAISRLRINPASDQPFSVEAVFTQDVPYVGGLTRIWQDPAGRICVTTSNQLIVIFADRKIPPSIMDLIPASELKQARPK